MEQQELEKIIDGCKKGRNRAYTKMVDCFGDKFYRYFYRLTQNADISNELLSQLFLKVVKSVKTFKGGSFESWLFGIASNLFNDYLRKKQRQKQLLKDYQQQLSDQNRPETSLCTDSLDIALARLSRQDRQLLAMRYELEMTFKDIAQLQGLPLGTVLSRFHRVIAKLRELMES